LKIKLQTDHEANNQQNRVSKTNAFALTFAFVTKHSKSKRECKQPHPFNADQTVNTADNSVYIQQRQHFGQKEWQLRTIKV